MSERPERILLTGASGFVGHHLRNALAAAFPAAALTMPAFDLADDAAVDSAVRDVAPDVCIHLAAVSAIAAAERNERQAWDVNLHGTLRLAHALLRHVPGCQMIFPASADAYGRSFRSGSALDESAPLAPMNIYGATKAAADLALGAMAERGLRVIRLRLFNHIGQGQSCRFVVSTFARQVARISVGRQAPIIEVGNIDTWRDFLDVRDVCTAYVACINRRDALTPGIILNIASGTPRRIADILADLQTMAGTRAEVRVDQSQVRDTDIHLGCGNAALARDQLDWTPVIAWHQTLHDVLDDWHERAAAEIGDV